MAQNWYYARGSQQFGPVTIDQLQGLLGTGVVQHADLVWTEGMAQWAPASTVTELAPRPAPAPIVSAPTPSPTPTTPYAPSPYAPPGAATQQAFAPNAPFGAGYAQNQPMGTPWPGQAMPPGMLNYAAPPQGEFYAGFWLRFCAAFVDGILLWIVGMVINVVLFAAVGENYFNYWPQAQHPMSPAAVGMSGLSAVFSILIGWLYYAFQESSGQQATLGKRAVGIAVTDLNGQRITFARATGRFFGKYISMITLFIGYIMAAFTAQKQALHDMMASTLVVKKNP